MRRSQPRERTINATSILIDATRACDGHAKAMFALLATNPYLEARSSMRILRRTLNTDLTATHVVYSGGGAFRAVPGTVRLVAFYDDLTRPEIGLYDVAKLGPLTHSAIWKLHLERVSEARALMAVNADGAIVATHSHPYPAGWSNPHLAAASAKPT
jgi:hypothetical protein